MARIRRIETVSRSTVCWPLFSHFSHPLPAHSLHGAVTRPVLSHFSQPAPLHAEQDTLGWNMAWPPAKMPGGLGTSCSSDLAVTLFPDPVSPTRPSVSPSWMSKLIPSTACTVPRF